MLTVLLRLRLAYFIRNQGSPFGSAVNVLFTNPLKFLLIAILVSIVSTTFHEFMHIIFSRNSRKINLNIAKAVATIPMTNHGDHLWNVVGCNILVIFDYE